MPVTQLLFLCACLGFDCSFLCCVPLVSFSNINTDHIFALNLSLLQIVLLFLVLHLVCLWVWSQSDFTSFIFFQSLQFLVLLFLVLTLSLYFFFLLLSFLSFALVSHGCLCMLWISVPMVCSVHPPASHSAPSFLRQYAGHLGRTALRREPGGGLERERAFLSLHRTGSLGIISHVQKHTHTLTNL